ncbi:methyltransferase domain-containing protein [candidate division WOR-3 bacterium]|nr:methyltransferase domain-containing protein [candidate division WOR-3 bacterium]
MKKKKPKPLDIESLIICPNCSHKITKTAKELYCTNCNSHYPIVHTIPILIASEDKHKIEEAAYHSSVSSIYRQLHQLESFRNIYYHLQSLKPILECGAHSTVLELGCGTGYDAAFLLKKRLIVVETDISAGQVLEAKKELVKKGLEKNALFYVADAENIPFADETFNATLITAALHHLEHPVKSLSEMKRCTKKEGIIVIAMEPNRYEWIRIIGYGFSIVKKIILCLLGEKLFKNILKRAKKLREPTVERTFSKREILSLMKEAGLYPQRIKGVWFTCGFIHWFITLLNKITKKTWYIGRDIEEIFVLIDECISKIPIINAFVCNWTIHCRRD